MQGLRSIGRFALLPSALGLAAALSCVTAAAIAPEPAMAQSRADSDQAARRAAAIVAQMTEDEKYLLIRGYVGATLRIPTPFGESVMTAPDGARQTSGFVPGVPRLGVPPLWETDASMGVANLFEMRPGDRATAFPSTLLLAASFDPDLAYRQGAVIGREAHAKGFNVLLGGGINLAREPRDGRTFEYLGEDPLLAGIMAGSAVAGTQSEHVVSTLKHFALNAQSTNQSFLDARIDPGALRESDLLAFQIANERGRPGAIMCSYNLINGERVCGSRPLLTDVLRRDWGFDGWVMSDWSATRSADMALAGLDQQSGSQMDAQPWFAEPLRALQVAGQFGPERLDEMATRIVTAMVRVGLIEHPPVVRPIDYAAHGAVAREVAEKGIILLQNTGGILPLRSDVRRVVVIGGFANLGVPGGGGSASVIPSTGPLIKIRMSGSGVMSETLDPVLLPGGPFDALVRRYPNARIDFEPGFDTAEAAAAARGADVVIVFVTRHASEGRDSYDLTLPMRQDGLVEAVAAANPNTVVVAMTGQPILMPWAPRVRGIVAAFFPGQQGAEAITAILSGDVNPSGHLPISFPATLAQLPRPQAPTEGVVQFEPSTVTYSEGSDVGYRWHARNGTTPLFAFGHGLSYTEFAYSRPRVTGGRTLRVTFDVTNTGTRPGADVPQVYLTSMAGSPAGRLIGFERVTLQPGEVRRVTVTADRRLLARFDAARPGWVIGAGTYGVMIGHASNAPAVRGEARLVSQRFAP